ncbi:hypothetical protein WJX72_003632 [[Myrmecia] bisecta]|uniref:Protein kinase domain-containing protein n=1 Tax=[Myrmecia] bisecta TaxID=41462 RepID=A0AAW1P9J4_9CHLO
MDPVCRLHKQGRNDPCTYVSSHEACTADNQFIDYLPAYYCANNGHAKPLMFALYLLWLMLLFYALSEVAEGFLVPAVEWISEQLKLTPAVAGVTLLSFAGGAPDLFTELAAITAGEQIELGLAVSSCMGSGLFIICIVTAVVVLIRPIEIADRTALVRDVVAYMLACLVSLQFMWSGRLHMLQLLSLVLLYVVYVGVAIYTSRHQAPVSNVVLGRTTTTSQRNLHTGMDPSLELPSWSPRVPQTPTSPTIPSAPSTGAGVPEVPPVVITAPTKDVGWPRGTYQGSRKGKESFAVEVNAAVVAKAPLYACGTSEGPELTPDCTGVARSRTLSSASSVEAEDVPMFRQPVPCTPRDTSLVRSGWAFVCNVFTQYIPLEGRNRFQVGIAVLTSPLVLFMHATNPSLHIETYGMVYGCILSATAPGFGLVGLGIGPETLGTAAFICLWVGFSIALLLATWLTLRQAGQPVASRANGWLAGLSFVMSAVWLSVVAKEVVALLDSFGHILNFRTDMIGGTILSWGETVPELVATYTLAKAGQGTMAIAACFGGPVFNLMIGLAGPVLYETLKKGSLPVQLTNGIILLVIQTIIVLALLLVAIPVVYKWHVPQRLGLYLVLTTCVQGTGAEQSGPAAASTLAALIDIRQYLSPKDFAGYPNGLMPFATTIHRIYGVGLLPVTPELRQAVLDMFVDLYDLAAFPVMLQLTPATSAAYQLVSDSNATALEADHSGAAANATSPDLAVYQAVDTMINNTWSFNSLFPIFGRLEETLNQKFEQGLSSKGVKAKVMTMQYTIAKEALPLFARLPLPALASYEVVVQLIGRQVLPFNRRKQTLTATVINNLLGAAGAAACMRLTGVSELTPPLNISATSSNSSDIHSRPLGVVVVTLVVSNKDVTTAPVADALQQIFANQAFTTAMRQAGLTVAAELLSVRALAGDSITDAVAEYLRSNNSSRNSSHLSASAPASKAAAAATEAVLSGGPSMPASLDRQQESQSDSLRSLADAFKTPSAEELAGSLTACRTSVATPGWDVSSGDIEVCQRPDGSPWVLGQGSFGMVFRALRRGHDDVAVKVLTHVDDRQLRHFRKEISILKSLSFHQNIVQFYGACLVEAGKPMLVLEYLEGGDLRQAMASERRAELRWCNKGQLVALDIARGLHFLHTKKVIHSDLKSGNILLTKDFGCAKIGDVGLARIMSSALHSHSPQTLGGTFAYAAPELLLNHRCSEKVDIYSLGIVLYEIVSGEAAQRGKMRTLKVPEECSATVARLVSECLEVDPRRRPTAEELVYRIRDARQHGQEPTSATP